MNNPEAAPPEVSRLGFCNAVYVYGANLAGQHTRGTARDAVRWLSAQPDAMSGITGECYALPVKDRQLRNLPLVAIAESAAQLVELATARPKLRFQLTRIGCGMSGYKDDEIAPLFHGYPPNLILPGAWNAYMSRPSVRVLLDVEPGASAAQVLAAMAGVGERFAGPELRRSILFTPECASIALPEMFTRIWRPLLLPDPVARFTDMPADERRRLTHSTLIWFCSDLVSVSVSGRWRSPLEREAREARLNVVIA